MTKIEDQSRLVIALKAFTGKLPPPYVNETEFFLVSLQNMAEYLADLQKEALKAGCDNFIRKLDAGTVTSKTIDEFKAVLGRLISSADLKIISASMVGSKSLIKQRLSALEPISLVAEWKKPRAAIRRPSGRHMELMPGCTLPRWRPGWKRRRPRPRQTPRWQGRARRSPNTAVFTASR